MPSLVYVAHPVGADIANNRRKILQICKEIHSDEIIPFAPYLIALEYLDDSAPEARRKGMEANKFYFRHRYVDELLVCGDEISEGMKEEIYLALVYHIPIKCYNPDLKEELASVIKDMQETVLKRAN